MIQRIQSVWLLLAAVCAVIMFIWPLYGGTLPGGNMVVSFMANSSFLLMLLIGLVALLSVTTIFLYKNRKSQMKLIWVTLLVNIGLIIYTYVAANRFASGRGFVSGGYKATAVLPIVVFILLILAFRGVRADEKLVRSTERFRN
jgi:hypothetical protein